MIKQKKDLILVHLTSISQQKSQYKFSTIQHISRNFIKTMQGSNSFLTTVPLGIRKVMVVPKLRELKSYVLDKCFNDLPNYILIPEQFFT